MLPFIFVTYPSLLLVVNFSLAEFLWLLPRLVLLVWLVSTALSNFEFSRLGPLQIGLRLVAAFALMVPSLTFQIGGLVLAGALVAHNRFAAGRVQPAA